MFVVMTLFIIVFCSWIKPSEEGFQLLDPARFPCSIEKPNLYGDYPVKKDPHLTNLSYSDIWTEYPSVQVGSYEQVTNNKKYWDNPNNGTCVRADMCNGIYNNKTLEKNPNATEMVVDGKKMPIKMQGSPYKMYGQDVSPNTVQGGSPLAKYGITTK